MAKVRGTIIKVPDHNPGLLMVEGEQRAFTLQGLWRSSLAPALNQVVDVEVDGSGALSSLTAVDPQQLAKERLNQLGEVAQQQGKQVADLARAGVGALASRMGKVALGATAVLWIAWFFLPAVKMSVFGISRSATFWEVLGSGLGPQGFDQQSHGPFAFLGLLAIAAPLVAPFLKTSRARLLNAAPLLYLVLTVVKVRWQLGSAMGQANGAMGRLDPAMAKMVAEMTDTAVKSLMSALSIGWGGYALVAAALVLAVRVLGARPSAAALVLALSTALGVAAGCGGDGPGGGPPAKPGTVNPTGAMSVLSQTVSMKDALEAGNGALLASNLQLVSITGAQQMVQPALALSAEQSPLTITGAAGGTATCTATGCVYDKYSTSGKVTFNGNVTATPAAGGTRVTAHLTITQMTSGSIPGIESLDYVISAELTFTANSIDGYIKSNAHAVAKSAGYNITEDLYNEIRYHMLGLTAGKAVSGSIYAKWAITIAGYPGGQAYEATITYPAS